MRAVLWAANEAAAREEPLTLVHGSASDELRYWSLAGARIVLDEGRALLEEAAAKVSHDFPQLKVDTVLSRSNPADSLLETARPRDTLVVGSRGHGGFTGLLVGSVGLRVCAWARGPVVVVREVTEHEEGEVVAAVRDDGDRHARRFAAEVAGARAVRLRVVGAWPLQQSVGVWYPWSTTWKQS